MTLNHQKKTRKKSNGPGNELMRKHLKKIALPDSRKFGMVTPVRIKEIPLNTKKIVSKEQPTSETDYCTADTIVIDTAEEEEGEIVSRKCRLAKAEKDYRR